MATTFHPTPVTANVASYYSYYAYAVYESADCWTCDPGVSCNGNQDWVGDGECDDGRYGKNISFVVLSRSPNTAFVCQAPNSQIGIRRPDDLLVPATTNI